MANALPVTLLALGAQSASDSGDAVDIGTRTAASLHLEVAAVTLGGGTFTVTIETSPDGTNWRAVNSISVASPASRQSFVAFGLAKHIRAAWTVAGGATATIGLAGTAHQIYIEPEDIRKYGMPGTALDDFTDAELLDYCLSVTDEADGYIGASYELPLTAWGQDLRMHAAKMAARYIMDRRGWDPEGADAVIMRGHEHALKWLDRISNGRLKPPGLIDTTTETFEGGSVVLSGSQRSWYA